MRRDSRKMTSTTLASLPCSSAHCAAIGDGVTSSSLHDGAFRLRHDLLRDDEDVSAVDAGTRRGHRGSDQPGEIGVTRHLGNAVDGEDVQIQFDIAAH